MTLRCWQSWHRTLARLGPTGPRCGAESSRAKSCPTPVASCQEFSGSFSTPDSRCRASFMVECDCAAAQALSPQNSRTALPFIPESGRKFGHQDGSTKRQSLKFPWPPKLGPPAGPKNGDPNLVACKKLPLQNRSRKSTALVANG